MKQVEKQACNLQITFTVGANLYNGYVCTLLFHNTRLHHKLHPEDVFRHPHGILHNLYATAKPVMHMHCTCSVAIVLRQPTAAGVQVIREPAQRSILTVCEAIPRPKKRCSASIEQVLSRRGICTDRVRLQPRGRRARPRTVTSTHMRICACTCSV